MDAQVSAPLLSRVKSWQLIGLGVSGWCTLYSVAIITWGASSNLIGNTQGGAFAATMTLASFEAKRYQKGGSSIFNSLQWINSIPTEHLNQTIAQAMCQREFRIETSSATERELGFGVRAVNAGRTMVFETGRWKEPVIDLRHARTTEGNRKKVFADLAIIVSAGKPDHDAKNFVRTQPVRFLTGKELKNLLRDEKLSGKKV
ncbi:MAG: hypothetical protein WCK57_04680 [Verrucomicrobiae bacterium]